MKTNLFSCCCWSCTDIVVVEPQKAKFPPFQQWRRNKPPSHNKQKDFHYKKSLFLCISDYFLSVYSLHLWLNFTRLAYEWRLIECKQLDISSILYWDMFKWMGEEGVERKFFDFFKLNFILNNYIKVFSLKYDKNLIYSSSFFEFIFDSIWKFFFYKS